MIPPVIGLCGNIGSGKNAVAYILHEEWGYVIRGFSDPLYRIMEILNPIIRIRTDHDAILLYNDAVAAQGIDFVKRRSDDVRRYLRLLGTECGRYIHGQDCWLAAMAKAMGNDRYTVIQGVRFPNEVGFIKTECRHGPGIMIHVSSPKEKPVDPSHSPKLR